MKSPLPKLPLAEILVPGFVVASLFVMFFNLPGEVMDWFLSLNITLSVIILLTTFFIRRPLDFNIFPTLLLTTTLFRLVLNVATTRLILTRAGQFGEKAAGEVIWAFSRFVTGESLVVGIVVFSIFIVIQFVVLTKGATRISEVTARFTLDALPGRQMAIDSDLHAGLIDEKEARRRREELAESADFFGVMDGAGKFVRGDAIASLIMIFVNMAGGVCVGMIQNGLSLTETLEIYSRLTIGDGLVSQVPALMISLATGILVSRGSRETDLSRQIYRQLVFQPAIFVIGGVFLLLLTLTGLPKLPLMVIASGCFLMAFTLKRHQEEERREEERRSVSEAKAKEEKEKEERRGKIETYLTIDPIELELGIGLVGLAEKGSGDSRGGKGAEIGMIGRIRDARIEIASEIGIILPKVRIRDRLSLEENRYRIKIFGEEVAVGMVWPTMFLAIDSEETGVRLDGIKTKNPADGKQAFWIEERSHEKAELFGFRILSADEVITEHLMTMIRRNSAELLTRDATAHLLEGLKEVAPHVVEDLIPDVMKLSEVQEILRRLLREGVSIRPLGTILEVLGDIAPRIQNPILRTERVRKRLARTLCGRYRNEEGELHVLMLDPDLEEKVAQNADYSGEEVRLTLSPEDSEEILGWLAERLNETSFYAPCVLLTGDSVRPAVRHLTEGKFPNLPVLSFGEITRNTRVVSDGYVRRTVKAA